MYENIPEDKPVYIAEALQNMLPELNSSECKTKMSIVDFLKGKEVIYKRVPVPEYVLK